MVLNMALNLRRYHMAESAVGAGLVVPQLGRDFLAQMQDVREVWAEQRLIDGAQVQALLVRSLPLFGCLMRLAAGHVQTSREQALDRAN